MGYDTIHETALRDILDILDNGMDAAADLFNKTRGGDSVSYAGSLNKATRGLIMEFPVLVSKANHIESAGIVAKAYEAKFVTMVQLALSAFNITNVKDGMEFIQNFHTNLDFGRISVDDFIDYMDSEIDLEGTMNADSYAKYQAIKEDIKNLSYYFEDDISKLSLNEYKVFNNNYGGMRIIKEEAPFFTGPDPIDSALDTMNKNFGGDYEAEKTRNSTVDTINKLVTQKRAAYYDARKDGREEENQGFNRNKDSRDTERLGLDRNKDSRDQSRFEREMITNNILPGEIKKANELMPTLMVVNIVVTNQSGDSINKQMIIGIKAKLYEVEPTEVINKLITKHADSNWLLKLVKVNTREISFVKDFLLAIDSAKLSALSKSRRGSTNKLFKVLERRALGGKIRKTLRMKNYWKAISSLVISQEEAEELIKNNIDVMNPKVMRSIMEQLNLMSFAIIDESSESVKFIFDTGDDVYETIPFSKLEKDGNMSTKKVINLMAKMNR